MPSKVTFKVTQRLDAQQPGVIETNLLSNATNAFARFIVNGVAVRAQDKAAVKLGSRLAGYIEGDIRVLIQNMATKISRGIAQRASETAPRSQMSIIGNMSQTARQLGWSQVFYASETNPPIRWAPRSPRYMAWKKKHGLPENWWVATGDLTHFLSEPDNYEAAFGPIKVLFFRSKKQPADVNFYVGQPSQGRAIEGTASVAATKRTVMEAYRGKQIKLSVGRVEVVCFGNITASMLPSLASGNPGDIGPDPGIAKLFESVDADAARKLTASDGRHPQRRAIDPFVSFYLTRAIPDAVMRRVSARLEDANL